MTKSTTSGGFLFDLMIILDSNLLFGLSYRFGHWKSSVSHRPTIVDGRLALAITLTGTVPDF